ncbi:MAG: polysaccharide biosynthesis tyrosine autokinase [Shimia sp.]
MATPTTDPATASMAPQMASQVPHGGPQDDEIDLIQLFGRLWAGKGTILLTMAVAVAIGWLVLANTAFVWKSDALLQLEERQSAMQLDVPEALAGLGGGGSDARAATELEIIRSRMILGQVVADLNLDWVVGPRLMPVVGIGLTRYDLPLPDVGILRPYARGGDAIGINYLEVPPAWLDREIVLTATAVPGEFTVDLPDGRRVPGSIQERIHLPDRGFTLEVARLRATAAGREFTLMQITEAEAIENIRDEFDAQEQARGSGIIEITYRDTDPVRAREVLDDISRVYVRQNIERSAAEADNSLQFIEAQLPDMRAKVRAAEDALNAYRTEQNSVDLGIEVEQLLEQITDIESQLIELQVREDEIAKRYTRNHPAYQQLLAQRERLQRRLRELYAEVALLPETQREVINFSRDLEIAQEAYLQLLERAQAIEVQRASTVGNIRVIDAAQTARRPVAPRRAMGLAIAALLGLVAGAGLVLLRAHLRQGIQSADEIEAMGMPVFATINESGKGRRDGVLAVTDPTDLTVEAYRSLRTSLHFGMLDATSRSLAITSAAPGAGKSFTSVNLAAVAAQAAQQVLLVDADMRRGTIRRYFDLPKDQPGLADYLAGDATFDEILTEVGIDGLRVVTTGRYPPNPAELLMRPTLAKLIAEADAAFDLTILDCPPVLAVTDPVVIGREVGGVIAVARHDETPPAEFAAVKRTFDTAGIAIAGALLNGFDPRKAARNGYGAAGAYRYDYRSDGA